jgi:predicted RNase H-like HicB family nuclease
MPNTYTAVTKQDGDWWIGWIEEVPGVNCQERSREELLTSLKESLSEALEFNRQDAIRAAESDYTEERVTV